MSPKFQASSAGSLANFVGADSEVEWILPPGAKIEIRQRKSLNKTLRFTILRKPGGPHLDRHSARIFRATAAPRIHQQIPEPPRSAAVCQSHTTKPNFITAACEKGGISFVQCLHTHIILALILTDLVIGSTTHVLLCLCQRMSPTIYDHEHAVERVRATAEVARQSSLCVYPNGAR